MKKTKLFNVHEKYGAKMVDFAGFKMPVQYSSIIKEHKAVRNSVGVFDVSHMGEFFISGNKAFDFIQYIVTNNAEKLYPGKVMYTAICYPDGGIVDDLLVYKISDNEFMMVPNAANKDKDYEWLQQNNNFDVKIEDKSDEYTLIAVQGPKSKEVLQKVCDKELDLKFYTFFNCNVGGVDALVSRTGYTGEHGYEIYFTGGEEDAEKMWNAIFEAGEEFEIKPAGLGARDSLRLEVGLCLYGNDIGKTTNPIEANLGWVTKFKKGDFIGREELLKVKENGPKRKLVPMVAKTRAFPRKGYEIKADGKPVGEITSGTVSPILQKPIAMGYVDINYAAEGQELQFVIRNKEIPAEVVKLPFVEKHT